MNPKRRLLTKSRFKLGHECPTKLFYTGKPEYQNQNDQNEFLKLLAEGGFQVGELAKFRYPGGSEIQEVDYDSANQQTQSWFLGKTPSLYEGAILHENLFIRVDVLQRHSPTVFDLIEVKAKSIAPDPEKKVFWNQRTRKSTPPQLTAEWEPYLYDIAFQYYVASSAYPIFQFRPKLLLVNKQSAASIDGMNQLFPVQKLANGRTASKPRANLTPGDLGESILVEIDVLDEVEFILKKARHGERGLGFAEYIAELASVYERDHRYTPEPSSACKKCEFFTEIPSRESIKSGFDECWVEAYKIDPQVLEEPLVIDLWKFGKTDIALRSGIYLLRDLPETEINEKESDDSNGLSQSQRQLLQLNLVKKNSVELYADWDSIQHEIKRWSYPLHFIDFETTAVALPFFKGHRPYESIAFQFSHHEMQSDGSYCHRSQFLSTEPGTFPNFEFVRALKRAVGQKGTIFRYTPHENTTLNKIKHQLSLSDEEDRNELSEFIDSITKTKGDKSKPDRVGPRCMVDLFEVLKKYYFDPKTRGSNSLKYVFPAVLNRSKYLQEKYLKPIYGKNSQIQSLNFEERPWIQFDQDGSIINPYLRLPPVLAGISFLESERLFSNSIIREGGSASMAYARMQFEEMKQFERQALSSALLKYCEIDTLAMVMLFEHWREQK